LNLINDLESQLSSLISKETEGVKIRSRAQWFEEGEKPTRYFFRLEKKRAEANTFESLLDSNGFAKTSPKDLENVLVLFYKNLQIQTQIIDDLESSLSRIMSVNCARGYLPKMNYLPL